MFFQSARKNLKEIQGVYPNTFWTLMGATFIDRLGGALLFPFFALYLTARFGLAMTQVGVLFALFAVGSLFGTVLSGALTDRLGRKWMLIAGLVLSAMSSLTMGFTTRVELFYLLAIVVGLLVNVGEPAQQAMVADLLPESRRPQGYAMIRIVANLALTIGPALGGLLASRSYVYLFLADAATSVVTAVIALFALPETRPSAPADQPRLSSERSFGGYRAVLRDGTFLAFLAISVVMLTVYIQMSTTLSVYLRDVHAIPERGYGFLISLNAGMVVALQLWVTRRVARHAPLTLMAGGAVLYALGFSLFGFSRAYALFMLAIVLITFGEMIAMPTGQALVAKMSPDDMRGRYMAAYGLTWMVPTSIGPLLAGIIMDSRDPRWVWYLAGSLGLIAATGFAWLHVSRGEQVSQTAE